jgi:hypothetical protein
MLATAQRGLSDLVGADPEQRPMGIYNVAVFGRSVTLVLQNLRTLDRQGFNAWYAPFEAEMAKDPLLAFFKKLRNEILKEGPPTVGTSMYIEHLDGRNMARLTANPPPGARGFFIGDQLGGSGWEVEMPDGSLAKYYVKLPSDIRIQMSLHLPDPPAEHVGKPVPDTSIETLSRLYVAYLSDLVEQAERHFGS